MKKCLCLLLSLTMLITGRRIGKALRDDLLGTARPVGGHVVVAEALVRSALCAVDA